MSDMAPTTPEPEWLAASRLRAENLELWKVNTRLAHRPDRFARRVAALTDALHDAMHDQETKP